MRLSQDLRELLARCALSNLSESFPHVGRVFGQLGASTMSFRLDDVVAEASTGQSVVTINGNGVVVRTLPVIAIRAHRPDGCFLAQLAKWDSSGVKVGCMLPGAKARI
eukprot:4697131-Amphidinium_carterae.1